jgi:uncharacterized repeat protein (TIGR01451 family)
MHQITSLIHCLRHAAAKSIRTTLFLATACSITNAWAQNCPVTLPVATTLTFSGAPSVFTVPNNVRLIRIIATGASGGIATTGGFAAGAGARAAGSYTVVSGQTVTAIVGGAGQSGVFEAGGGGASGAYLGTALAVIAGGGGGQDNTGNGGGGQATNNALNAPGAANQGCPVGGLGGTAGAGGQFGELDTLVTQACQIGNGGAGGGGLNSAGGSSALRPPASPVRFGPTGGGQCSIAGAPGGLAGADGAPPLAAGVAGGFGLCGGGGADTRESGGGGGYSGGAGGPESTNPTGGGSFVSATAVTPTLVAGTTTAVAQNGRVLICYALPIPTRLAITKTNSTTALAAGSTTTYTIVASNNGPGPADSTSVRDPVNPSLSCTNVSCGLPTGGAVCPPLAGTTIANLQSAGGIVLPSLPANSSLTFTVTCGVKATGL